MPSLEPEPPDATPAPLRLTRTGSARAVLILMVLAVAAVIVVLAGNPAQDVALVIGPLTPLAALALGQRERGGDDSHT